MPGERKYTDAETSRILEWLGDEHGANAIEILCSEFTDPDEPPVRREGAVLGLVSAIGHIFGALRAVAEQTESPGLRKACLGALDELSDAAKETD